MQAIKRGRNLITTFILGIVLIVLISLAIFNLVMKPPGSDFTAMAVFLSITALISGLAGYTAYRLRWLDRSPTIRWALLAGYLLSSALTFLNVWVTATLMFNDRHDLFLATILLFFAGGIATVLGVFFSSALNDRIQVLKSATQRLSQGNFDVRVNVTGRDELAELGETFNQMASQLGEAERRQRELEILRRDLIAWVGHDLQTPLASMRAILEALRDGIIEDPQEEKRYLGTVLKDIRSLSALIDDLFQMAQLDAGGLVLDRSENSLADLLSDTLESFSQIAKERDVQLNGSVQAGLDLLNMDVQRIGRVLNNLISNAIRHTPPGGNVLVSCSLEGSRARVTVQDNGEGIPQEDLPHIFERFYRGEKSRSRQTGGSGLGLAISKGIIEAHGGEIQVESKPGEGTRFTFFLPR